MYALFGLPSDHTQHDLQRYRAVVTDEYPQKEEQKPMETKNENTN